MKQYAGTKLIKAEPMTRGKYNKYRGWEIPKTDMRAGHLKSSLKRHIKDASV